MPMKRSSEPKTGSRLRWSFPPLSLPLFGWRGAISADRLRISLPLDWMTALLNNAALMWVLSVITLTAGLAMVLAHNVWSGGTLPVVVTLVGWATLIKGLLFLFLPSGVESEFILSALRNPLLFYVWMTPSLVIGIYLTYGGFASKATRI
jgi:hypothetical protein